MSNYPDQGTKYPAIILAAGMSRRMGQTKALLPLGGRPMVRWVVDTCLASGSVDEVVVVTGYESSRIQEVLADRPVNFVFNADYETGEMLSSVQAGVRALASDCKAFFLLPCDQPLVQPSTFTVLANRFRETHSPVVSPAYLGKPGHPVLISTAVIHDILALGEGDTLKSVLIVYRDSSSDVDVDDPGILFDVDTQQQYEQMKLREETFLCEFD